MSQPSKSRKSATTPEHTAQPRPRAAPAALSALESARQHLREAAHHSDPAMRYVHAHLAALRSAAAVVAQREQGGSAPRRGRRPRSVWELLARAAPELSEWAARFAAGARKRAAAEAYLPNAVNSREADDLLADAQTFLGLVISFLGVPDQPLLPEMPRAS